MADMMDKKTDDKAGRIPRTNDALKRRLDDFRERGRQEREEWEPLDTQGRNYLYNNQLATMADLPPGIERVQANYIAKAVYQELAVVSQQYSTILVHPQSPEDNLAAQKWKPILEWQYHTGLDMPTLRIKAKLQASTYGRGVAYVYWDDRAEWDEESGKWLGAVRARMVNRRAYVLDPDADTVDDARWCYHECDRAVDELLARYPKWRSVIEAAARDRARGGPQFVHEAHAARSRGEISLDGGPVGGGEREVVADAVPEEYLANLLGGLRGDGVEFVDRYDGSEPQSRFVTVRMYWMKDAERESRTLSEPVSDADAMREGMILRSNGRNYLSDGTTELTPENRPTRKRTVADAPKYPHGRYVMQIGDVVVLDEPWPLTHWPFVHVINLPLPDTTQGINASVLPKSLQDAVNRAVGSMILYIRLHGEPHPIIEQDVMLDGRAPSSKPGAIWEVKSGKINALRNESPPPLSQGVMAAFDVLTGELKDQTGVQDVGLGKRGGAQTAFEISKLETNTRLRTALQTFFLDRFTVGVMERVQELCQKYWEPGMKVRLAGREGTPRKMTLQQEQLDVRFDLDLDVGTKLPFDQQRNQEKADKLIQVLGMAYLEEYLRAYDVPNPEQIMEAFWMQQEEQARQQTAEGAGDGQGITAA